MTHVVQTSSGPPWRVEVFVDGSNLYRSVRDMFGLAGGYDIAALTQRICRNRHAGRSMRLTRIFYYTAPLPQSFGKAYDRQRRFLEAIQRVRGVPLVVRLGRLQRDRKSGVYHEKGVDVRIATDMVVRAYERRFDLAVLVSRDGDLAPAVDHVRQINDCRVLYASVPGEPSWVLSHSCNGHIPITRETLDACRIDSDAASDFGIDGDDDPDG